MAAGVAASSAGIPRLTLGPPALPAGEVEQSVFLGDEAESDILPFALDADMGSSSYDIARVTALSGPAGAPPAPASSLSSSLSLPPFSATPLATTLPASPPFPSSLRPPPFLPIP